MSSPTKRRETDIMKLLMNDYKVDLNNDDMKEFHVEFKGPVDTPYQGGVWKVKVELPDDYPLHSPSIGFANKIYHPNIDELTGTVCMNVINEEWSAMFDLVNVFELFLPQLLTKPNASDPMNDDAAALMISDKAAYDARVKEYVERYATPEVADDAEEDQSTDKEASEETSNSGDDASGSGPVEP